MSQVLWVLGGLVAIAAIVFATRRFGRAAMTRAAVLEEVRRTLRDGTHERGGAGPAVRGYLGSLLVTVDIQRDLKRPRQSPMWRVTAQGPVALDRPVEVRVGGWEGWIDPWLQLGEALTVTSVVGPAFTLHAERITTTSHPLATALRRQGDRLGPGAFHARQDLMRVETRCGERLEENRALFAYLNVIGEIAELPSVRTTQPAGPALPRYGMLPEGS